VPRTPRRWSACGAGWLALLACAVPAASAGTDAGSTAEAAATAAGTATRIQAHAPAAVGQAARGTAASAGTPAAAAGRAPDAAAMAWLPWRHGASYFDRFRYPEDFTHFDWVNADAPKGGLMVLFAASTFDSFNPLIARGRVAAGLAFGSATNWLYDRLLEPSADEVATAYGRLAEAVQVSGDLTRVRFRLRPQARWHDGQPVTASDVAFAFDVIRSHGAPTLRTLYRPVVAARVLGPHEIEFEIDGSATGKADLVLLLGDLYPLPRHYWATRDVGRVTLEPPLGSGPYRIARVIAGRSVEYQRVADWWGRDLPVNRGRFNLDRLRYEYFLDSTLSRAALRTGVIDLRVETVGKEWLTAYDFPATRLGHVVAQKFATRVPSGLGWLAFIPNLRRPMFRDVRVREAIALARDFEWENRVVFWGFHERANSYFSGTPFAQAGPPDPVELALLAPMAALVPARALGEAPRLLASSGIGMARDPLRRAAALLDAAGWTLRDGRRVDPDSGAPFVIEFIYSNSLGAARVTPFAQRLARLGIEVRQKHVEESRYVRLLRTFDFDMTLRGVPTGSVPTSSLRDRFHSETANEAFTANWAGISNPAVDALVERAEHETTFEGLRTALAALDRVLLWNFYMIPGMHPAGEHYAFTNRYGRPPRHGAYRPGIPDTWWWDAARAQRIVDGLPIPPDPPLGVIDDDTPRDVAPAGASPSPPATALHAGRGSR
jgi:microcin C transport system substrate-binding protein